MLYAMQAIAYTAAMLLIYVMLLRNKAHHALSRAYLLLCAALPVVLPLLHLPQTFQQRLPAVPKLGYTLPEVSIGRWSAGADSTAAAGLPAWLVVYLLVSLLFIVVYSTGLVRLLLTIKSNNTHIDGSNTLVLNTGFGPGSFGKYIFFPGTEVDGVILAHEEAHIRMYHSLDIVLLSLLQAMCWPNIFLYLIKKELKEVHEFQADEAVHADAETYTALILSATFNTTPVALMHSFINHPIKRRIMMLRKNGSGSTRKATLKIAVVTCLLCSAAIIIQSCANKGEPATTKTAAQRADSSEVQVPDSVKQAIIAKTEEYHRTHQDEFPEKMPRFNGDISQFLSKELHYPAFAKEHKIQGRVIVKFVISKAGKILNPEIVKSPDTSLSRAALEVIAKMPDWEPGEKKGLKVDVPFYQPIMFQL